LEKAHWVVLFEPLRELAEALFVQVYEFLNTDAWLLIGRMFAPAQHAPTGEMM